MVITALEWIFPLGYKLLYVRQSSSSGPADLAPETPMTEEEMMAELPEGLDVQVQFYWPHQDYEEQVRSGRYTI